MHLPQLPPRRKTLMLVGVLLLVGVVQRAVTLTMLWPDLVSALAAVGSLREVMQLLPHTVLRQAFGPAMLYLQMAPPLPNLVYALPSQIADTEWRMGSMLVLQSAISIATSILLALLLVRLQLSHWLALLAGALFMLWGDLMLMEYSVFGFLLHETLTMLLCLLCCHAALSTARRKSCSAAATLGLTVALLALTRATFSYFVIVVLAWFLISGLWRQRRLLLAMLLPVVVLHGGWSLKNLLVHDHFSIATSTWGGANLLHGELLRNGDNFYLWQKTQSGLCEEPWQQLATRPEVLFTFMVNMENEPSVPAAIAEADRRIATQRGYYARFDTQAARELSACLQRQLLHFWWQNPGHAIHGWWRSYQNFWLPLRALGFFPLNVHFTHHDEAGFQLTSRLRDALNEYRNPFLMFRHHDISQTTTPASFSPAPLLVIPALGSLISLLGLLSFHSSPLLLLVTLMRGRQGAIRDLLFPVLTIAYLLALTSVVEFSENMRFRLAVEPLLWTLALISIRQWVLLLRKARPPKPLVE